MARIDEAYTEEEFAHFKNILSNGTARIPVCFCIDVSKSMGWSTNSRSDYDVIGQVYEDGRMVDKIRFHPGKRPKSKMDDLKNVLRNLIYGLQEESELRESAILNIVTFSKYADTISDFCEPTSMNVNSVVGKIRVSQDNGAKDDTNVSSGINLALDNLSKMSNVLENAQTESFKPVFILISDGAPTDRERAKILVSKLNKKAVNEEISIIPIGIYMDAPGREWLSGLRPDGKIYTMNNDADFEQVFNMIKELIVYKAPIIPVDENIMADNKFAKEINIPTTAYGQTSKPEDLLDVFNFLSDDIV